MRNHIFNIQNNSENFFGDVNVYSVEDFFFQGNNYI